jgi:nitrite reductase/ring-hydroxylating ferredoxin subunit
MPWFRRPSKEPLWRDEFSVYTGDERYVNRRQMTKFLTITSLGMFAGNLWILLRAWLYEDPVYAPAEVATVGEIPVGGVKLFSYPTPTDRCLMVRTGDDEYVAYSQKCTHLACAVFYSSEQDRLECPCHEGYFSVRDGSVLQGPPTRPLPRVVLERRDNQLVAVAMTVRERA